MKTRNLLAHRLVLGWILADKQRRRTKKTGGVRTAQAGLGFSLGIWSFGTILRVDKTPSLRPPIRSHSETRELSEQTYK